MLRTKTTVPKVLEFTEARYIESNLCKNIILDHNLIFLQFIFFSVPVQPSQVLLQLEKDLYNAHNVSVILSVQNHVQLCSFLRTIEIPQGSDLVIGEAG
jgi:hypothetical protein